MSILDIKVEDLQTVREARMYGRLAANELAVLTEDTLFGGEIRTPEVIETCKNLENLIHDLRVRMYELQDPLFSDGTIDLYIDKETLFTICEHNKKEPIGTIEYFATKSTVPGNISYEIYTEYRGHHYALRALKIIGEELLKRGITSITITATSNKNIPSIKTIEEFGGKLHKGIDKLDQGPIPYTCDLKKIYSK